MTKYKIFVQPQGEGQPKLYQNCNGDMELDQVMRQIGFHFTTEQANVFRDDINSDSKQPGKYWSKFTVVPQKVAD